MNGSLFPATQPWAFCDVQVRKKLVALEMLHRVQSPQTAAFTQMQEHMAKQAQALFTGLPGDKR
jgi:hypothetical protein